MVDIRNRKSNIAVICRVLGNELPPRDSVGSRLPILNSILEAEPEFKGVVKLFIINRVLDAGLANSYSNILEEQGYPYFSIPFNKSTEPNYSSMVSTGIDLNYARNLGIDIGLNFANWVVILDGDCFFTEADWNPVAEAIVADNYDNLSIPHVRRGTSKLGEPMLAFSYRSNYRFDTNLAFGDRDKLDLLIQLGHDPTPLSGHLRISGDKTLLVGKVNHIPTGSAIVENDVFKRTNARKESITKLIDRYRQLIK